jgi:hypothetical protein
MALRHRRLRTIPQKLLLDLIPTMRKMMMTTTASLSKLSRQHRVALIATITIRLKRTPKIASLWPSIQIKNISSFLISNPVMMAHRISI